MIGESKTVMRAAQAMIDRQTVDADYHVTLTLSVNTIGAGVITAAVQRYDNEFNLSNQYQLWETNEDSTAIIITSSWDDNNVAGVEIHHGDNAAAFALAGYVLAQAREKIAAMP